MGLEFHLNSGIGVNMGQAWLGCLQRQPHKNLSALQEPSGPLPTGTRDGEIPRNGGGWADTAIFLARMGALSRGSPAELGQAEQSGASLVVGAKISSRSCQGILPTQTGLEKADGQKRTNGQKSGKHLESRPGALLVSLWWNCRKNGDGAV